MVVLKNGRLNNPVEAMFLLQGSRNEDEKLLVDADWKKSGYVLVLRMSI